VEQELRTGGSPRYRDDRELIDSKMAGKNPDAAISAKEAGINRVPGSRPFCHVNQLLATAVSFHPCEWSG
jgi:hypothetical protein